MPTLMELVREAAGAGVGGAVGSGAVGGAGQEVEHSLVLASVEGKQKQGTEWSSVR